MCTHFFAIFFIYSITWMYIFFTFICFCLGIVTALQTIHSECGRFFGTSINLLYLGDRADYFNNISFCINTPFILNQTCMVVKAVRWKTNLLEFIFYLLKTNSILALPSHEYFCYNLTKIRYTWPNDRCHHLALESDILSIQRL